MQPLNTIANSSSMTKDYLDKLIHLQIVVTSTTLNTDRLEFCRLHAKEFLNGHIEARDIDYSISLAPSTILMHRSSTWSNAVTLWGLAALVISLKDILNNNSLYKGIILDYSIKYKISDESLSKLTKN